MIFTVIWNILTIIGLLCVVCFISVAAMMIHDNLKEYKEKQHWMEVNFDFGTETDVDNNESDYKICNECGRKMVQQPVTKTFHINGSKVDITMHKAYKCNYCDEVVYSPKDIRFMEDMISNLKEVL